MFDIDQLQEDGKCVLENAFPCQAEVRLPYRHQESNERTIASLLSGETHSFVTMVTGSRAEGFALASNYTRETPDLDMMFLYGGNWCVRIPNVRDTNANMGQSIQTYPEMSTESCTSGYCQIYIKGSQNLALPAARCSYFPLTIINVVPSHLSLIISYLVTALCLTSPTYRRQVLRRALFFYLSFAISSMVTAYLVRQLRSRNVFRQQNGHKLLLPKAFLQELSCQLYFPPQKFQGPSHAVLDFDLVPALICNRPFPCMEQYLARERSTIWPPPKALAQIAAMPGVLVPTGSKGSPNIDTEWRYSFSVQEICLSQEMPGWIKAGYRAFKYTLKHHLHALRTSLHSTDKEDVPQDTLCGHLVNPMMSRYTHYQVDFQQRYVSHMESAIDVVENNDGHVCSYHLKTILLWSLEDPGSWEGCCPLRFMLRLLHNLECHLQSRSLPHYFNIDNNLLANISMHELALARACVVEILRDPVAAMRYSIAKPRDSNSRFVFSIDGMKQLISEHENYLGTLFQNLFLVCLLFAWFTRVLTKFRE